MRKLEGRRRCGLEKVKKKKKEQIDRKLSLFVFVPNVLTIW